MKAALALMLWSVSTLVGAVELVIATVDNGHMITMQKLGHHFEKAHPGIRLRWVPMPEGRLRQQVTADITTGPYWAQGQALSLLMLK